MNRISVGLLKSNAWKIRRLLMALPVVFCAYFLAADENGVYQIWHRDRQLQALRQEIVSLEAENERLAMDLERLKTDPRAIERIARERYGMVLENERVYMVYPTRPPSKDAAGSGHSDDSSN